MPLVRFEKYEGLGNDFVVIDDPSVALERDEIVRLCDRRRGIGADGVLFVRDPSGRPAMRIVNADGSRAEMCGNGLRCVVHHLARRGLARAGDPLVVDTDAGPHDAHLHAFDDASADVWVSMRAPSLAPSEVPHTLERPMRDHPVAIGGHTLHVTAVSMGNPHAVIFDEVGDARLALGPLVRGHALFPEGANVGFASLGSVAGRATIELHVFERGAGWTQACGTGACAAVVAAIETGRIRRGAPVEVRLPGGALEILVGEPSARIEKRGPSRHTFSGSFARAPR